MLLQQALTSSSTEVGGGHWRRYQRTRLTHQSPRRHGPKTDQTDSHPERQSEPPPTCISELRFLLKLVTTNKAFKEIRSHLIFLTRKGNGAFRYNLWFRFTIYSPSWGRISCRNCAAQQSQSSRLSSDLGASVWTPVSPWSPPNWLRGGRLTTPPAGRTHCRERAPETMEKKSTVQRGFKEQGWGYSKLLLWTYHDKIRGNVLFRLLILAIFSDLSVNMQVYFWGTFSYFWF